METLIFSCNMFKTSMNMTNRAFSSNNSYAHHSIRSRATSRFLHLNPKSPEKQRLRRQPSMQELERRHCRRLSLLRRKIRRRLLGKCVRHRSRNPNCFLGVEPTSKWAPPRWCTCLFRGAWTPALLTRRTGFTKR